MPYEQRYCDVKSDLSFTLRNVIIVVVIVHVRLQFPSREALAIKPKSPPELFRVAVPRHSMWRGWYTQRRVRVRVRSTSVER